MTPHNAPSGTRRRNTGAGALSTDATFIRPFASSAVSKRPSSPYLSSRLSFNPSGQGPTSSTGTSQAVRFVPSTGDSSRTTTTRCSAGGMSGGARTVRVWPAPTRPVVSIVRMAVFFPRDCTTRLRMGRSSAPPERLHAGSASGLWRATRAHREPASSGRFTPPVIFPRVSPRRRHAGGRFPHPHRPDSGPAARPGWRRAPSEKHRSTMAPLSLAGAPCRDLSLPPDPRGV